MRAMTIESTGKTEQAYRTIRRLIETGELRPNQELPESLLTGDHGLSRTPSREALSRLAVEGLVTLAPRATPRVTALTSQDVRQLFEYRRLLESEAAATVAREAGQDAGILVLFQRLNDRFRALTAHETGDDFLSATEDFDAALASCVSNRYLQQQIREVRSHSIRLRAIAHRTVSRREESIADHIRMTDAISAADPEQARLAIKEHLHHVEQTVFNGLIEAGEL